MIKEAYVSFEVAKLLKEKGFNWEVKTFYTSDGKFEYCAFELNHNLDIGSGFTSAPTHQMAMAWLREMHNFIVLVEYDIFTDKFYCYIRKRFSDYIIPTDSVNSYEESVEVALKYTLENLI